MSGQQPGPVPEAAPDGMPAPVTTPVTTAAFDVEQPARGAAPAEPAPGWGAPGWAASGWGEPPHGPAAPAQGAAPGWGAPPQGQPGPKRASAAKPWTLKRGLVVGGAAVVLAAGAGVGVYALTSSSAAADGTARSAASGLGGQGSAQGGFPGGGMPGQGGPGNFAPDGTAGMAGGLASAVHAEYVVLQGGAYVAKAEQLGTVAEISSGSITVKSSDGFTRSYALGAGVVVGRQLQRRQQAGGATGSQLGLADLASGATVRIVAGKNGSDYAAESVLLLAAAATGQSN